MANLMWNWLRQLLSYSRAIIINRLVILVGNLMGKLNFDELASKTPETSGGGDYE
jgi:hypothetical protein